MMVAFSLKKVLSGPGLVCLAVMLIPVTATQSATIRVPTDSPTIQGAVDQANLLGGDVVLIEDSGVYSEKIQISRSIRLMAAPGQTPTIRSNGDPQKPYMIRHSDAAIGSVIGSNEGGRITIDGDGDPSIIWHISNRHTSGEITFENLLLTGGHDGANSFIYPEIRVRTTVTFNNVIVDAQDVVEFPVRPDLLRGGTINFNEVVITGAKRMAILHSNATGVGNFNIHNSKIVAKQVAIAIEPGGGPITWALQNSYFGSTDSGSWAAMWVRAPDQRMTIVRSVFDMAGSGSSFFLFPAVGCDLYMDHCDILSNYIGFRMTSGTNRRIEVRNTNIVSTSVGYFGDTHPTDDLTFAHNNIPGGYGTFPTGMNDVIPGLIPNYPVPNFPHLNFAYTTPALLVGDDQGGPIGSRFEGNLPPEPTFTPTPTFTPGPTSTPTPTPDPASTSTPTPTPNASELDYINQFITYFTGIGQVPAQVPTLEEYATPAKYDQLHFGATQSFLTSIAANKNLNAGMAWGSAYHHQSLNDMFRATGDLKYLRASRAMTAATLANRDDKVGFTTFFGESAPAWGTPYYAGRHVIHLVHTGTIAFGVVEFLELAQSNPTMMAELGQETFDLWSMEIQETLDWHDRQWIDGPEPDEGFYLSKDEEVDAEGSPQATNRLSAIGMVLWGSWKATGNPEHRDKALKLGLYMKRRLGLYQGPSLGEGAIFWGTSLPYFPVPNPLPESELVYLGGGEDYSHASLSVLFPLELGRQGFVFTPEDMKALGRTITHGHGRLGNGILYGNVVGTPAFGPDQVQVVGNFLRVVDHSPEGFQATAEFMLRYQRQPRNVDLSQLIRFLPKEPLSVGSSWRLY